MKRRQFLSLLGAAPLAAQRAAARRPNVVFFLMDDMGWMDTTVYGSRYYETPNMERLARRSMIFSDAYSASPLCSPTRASILTGKHPARVGITTACGHTAPAPPGAPRFPETAAPSRRHLLPESLCFLRPDEFTIAEAFKEAGYRTGHIGKWHLGLNPEHWPDKQGFDVAIHGKPDPGPPSYFSPYRFRAGTLKDGPAGEYITDRITDESLKFLDAHKQGPFLLHVWHHAVHGPWGYKEDYAKAFESRTDPRGKQNNAVMAAMLKSADESLGRVLDKLDQLGITNDTIFIFFSDNGGNIHSRIGPKELPPTNNEPLSEGKGRLHEGGTRVPAMVAWPGVVKPGSKSAEVISSVDWYPTMLEMAGLKPKSGLPLDGESIVPVLKGSGQLKREAIFCYFPHGGPARPPGIYVRKGDWKLIRYYETGPEHPAEFELYNLRDDLSEATNLAARMPDRVRAMNGLIDDFLVRTEAVVPKTNPAYNANAPKQDDTAPARPRRNRPGAAKPRKG